MCKSDGFNLTKSCEIVKRTWRQHQVVMGKGLVSVGGKVQNSSLASVSIDFLSNLQRNTQFYHT